MLAASILFAAGAAPARAAADESDLDRLISDALAEVPVERTEEAIRFLLETELGSSSVHAVSPGSLWNHDSGDERLGFSTTDAYFASDGNFGGCAYVPLHLRGDATITGLVILFIDDWNGEDYQVDLRRKLTGSNTAAETLASASSSGASASHRIATDLTVTNGAINDTSYFYFLWVCRPSFGSELHGIYLTYTY